MSKKKSRILISVLALVLGLVLIVFGIFRGEAEGVFMKSIRICMECIGIG